MSLRDINHQVAIELGECDTEFVTRLKQEREQLLRERSTIPVRNGTLGSRQRRVAINLRLARIKELLNK